MSNELETMLVAAFNAIGVDVATAENAAAAVAAQQAITNNNLADLNAKVGPALTTLTTSDKTSVVGAIISLQTAIDAISGYTDGQADQRVQAAKGDFANPSSAQWADTQSTSDKIATDIAAALATLTGAAPQTLDTIQELAAAFGDNPDAINNLTNAIGNRVAYTPQTKSIEEKRIACGNIGVGDPTHDYLADYNAGKDSV